MDAELLIALWVLWLSVWIACLTAALMWTFNRGEAFHPHCVELQRTHRLFEVVHAATECKRDCAVKSVSAFISPRGSSSDKYFTVLITIMSISGFFGSVRWHIVGDASLTECILSCIGFLSLILVPVFELDVSNNSFVEEKLAVTVSFLRILNVYDMLDINWTQYSPEILNFVRDSADIKHLYIEAEGVSEVHPTILSLGFVLHCVGAGSFVAYVTAAIISNDYSESHLGVFVMFGMNMFLLLTYFCGTYLPIGLISPKWVANQGQILSWNPFVQEQDFLIKLQKAVNGYHEKIELSKLDRSVKCGESDCHISPSKSSSSSSSPRVTRRRSRRLSGLSSHQLSIAALISEDDMEKNAISVLNRYRGVRLAKARPKLYLRLVSYLMVLTELATLLVPMVAIGAQWMTALCKDTPSVTAIFSLTYWSLHCLVGGKAEMCDRALNSCIVASN